MCFPSWAGRSGRSCSNRTPATCPSCAAWSGRWPPTCPAAGYARARALPLGLFPQKDFGSGSARDAAMAAWLRGQGVELVVAAGWDRVLSDDFVVAFRDRILNIHPSLLPAFAGGMDAV